MNVRDTWLIILLLVYRIVAREGKGLDWGTQERDDDDQSRPGVLFVQLLRCESDIELIRRIITQRRNIVGKWFYLCPGGGRRIEWKSKELAAGRYISLRKRLALCVCALTSLHSA